MDKVISNEILQQFKDRMHLGDDEDDNLRRILFASTKALIKDCGAYDINEDETFKELVFERSRYVYNDALEYFTKNFLTEINSFGIAKALEEINLDGE
ncbi:hypothetical protein P4U05_11320 [Bacillus paranthracis]|uniref:hypothetical protein n=1 Tax=Bacillus paranthracis TaxID=2026186 RepID=UPI000200EDC2|nr:hypothetical protein [Bacillus paranthracis]ADY19649.1 hypothetical protein YBT020_01985 [Bacillus thuringiensis serovar finitimus YBT-020]MRC71216.1 hypothetical protein [Bacillus thuringiensis]OTX74362.1 hypothetical protein BK722_06810 [Bacillus thuringiensis serovar finitimus]HDR7485373.1 hypothetical protein [Bacillus pacificus]MCR6800045.1 hypothetical protein [Bacillus paranthracis]